MKKIVLSLLTIVMLSCASFAGVGVALKAGIGQTDSDVEKVKDTMYTYTYTDDASGIFGVELFYEQAALFGMSENSYLGAKLGYTARGNEELKGNFGGGVYMDDEVKYYEVPLTLYYKYAVNEKLGLIGGAGIAFGKAKANEISESKAFPFLTAGVEYKFNQYVALGFDAKYNISAKFKKEDFLLRDVNGIEGLVSLKFFFN